MYFQLQDHMENHCRKSKLPCYFAELGCKKMVHKKPILSFSCSEVKKRFVFCCRQVSKLKLIVTIKIFFTYKSIFFQSLCRVLFAPYAKCSRVRVGQRGQWNTNIPEKKSTKYPKIPQIPPNIPKNNRSFEYFIPEIRTNKGFL